MCDTNLYKLVGLREDEAGHAPSCFARRRPVSPARVLGCTGIAAGVAFSSPAFMRGMYFSTNLILVNAVNHLLSELYNKMGFISVSNRWSVVLG